MAPDIAAEDRTDPGPPARHLLSTAAFNELAAGGGGPATVAALWRSEQSRRFVLLRALYDMVRVNPALLGPLPPLAHAWEALERAHEAAPAAVSELLLSPSVGSWISFVFRDHARDTPSAHSYAGQLHVVALAASALAGQPFMTRVPLRNGQVFIPLRGLVRFTTTNAWDTADAGTDGIRTWFEYAGQRVEIPEDGTETDFLWPLRRISTGSDGGLTVYLDDLDPMRDLADPIPPARLSDDEVARWQRLLDGAWSILTRYHPGVAESMTTGVTTLVPLPMGPIDETRSASSGDAFGSVMVSPPPDATTLAVSLVHEFAHIRLGGLMHLLRLTEGAESPTLYAPWRDDPRPLGGLLQGVYAFFAIAEFWRRQRNALDGIEAALAEFEYAYARAQATDGLHTVQASGGLTAHGTAFTDRLGAELRSWADDTVDTHAANLARLVADSHRIGWRIRHCIPSTVDVEMLNTLWHNRKTQNVHIGPSDVQPDPAMRQWSQGRLGLARRRILAPDQHLDASANGWAASLTDADLALFAGDALAASKGFADQIVENADALDAWTGLGLALAGEGAAPAGTALLRRPEVVLAVYRTVNDSAPRRASPADVATWVGKVLRL